MTLLRASRIALILLATGALLLSASASAQTLININTADAETLDLLPGVGPAIAARIIAYREGPDGPFDTPTEIKEVSGIGEVTYANMAHMITVSATTVTEENGEDDDGEVKESEDDSSGTSNSSSSRKSDEDIKRVERAFQSDTALGITVRGPSRAYVHRDTEFSVSPEGLSVSELMTMRYFWNFGDGTISTERTPSHVYTAAGNYKVIVEVTRDGHHSVGEMAVTVLPITLLLARSGDDVVIHNDSRYEVDVSGVTIVSGEDVFTLPEHTYLLANASLTLPPAKTGFSTSHAFLRAHDAHGVVLAQYPDFSTDETERYAEAVNERPVASVRQSQTVAPPSVSSSREEVVAQPNVATATEAVEDNMVAAINTTGGAAATAAAPPVSSRRQLAPYALLAVLAIALLALYSHKLV